MFKKRKWNLFIEDILESIGLIEEYIKGMKFENFVNDRKTIDAVIRNLEIIGEASKYIPDDVKKRFANIDWKGIVGLRNRITHEYFGLSVSIVWEIITKELNILKEKIKKVVKN